jgi:hypothetical protein
MLESITSCTIISFPFSPICHVPAKASSYKVKILQRKMHETHSQSVQGMNISKEGSHLLTECTLTLS